MFLKFEAIQFYGELFSADIGQAQGITLHATEFVTRVHGCVAFFVVEQADLVPFAFILHFKAEILCDVRLSEVEIQSGKGNGARSLP